jgi:hypothetical protein
LLRLINRPACDDGIWRLNADGDWVLWVMRTTWGWRNTHRRQPRKPAVIRPKHGHTEWRQADDGQWEEWARTNWAVEDWSAVASERPARCLCGDPLIKRDDGSFAPAHVRRT